MGEKSDLSFLWYSSHSVLPFISPLPSKTVPSSKYTTRESQKTYSSSSRVQVGCWRTRHRSFIPLSSSLFAPRSRCTKLLLFRRAVERKSLPTGVKRQHRNLQGSTEWVKTESSLPPSAGLICSTILRSDLLLPACLHVSHLGQHQTLTTGLMFFRANSNVCFHFSETRSQLCSTDWPTTHSRARRVWNTVIFLLSLPGSRIAPGWAFHTINQMVIFVFLKVHFQKRSHGTERQAWVVSQKVFFLYIY